MPIFVIKVKPQSINDETDFQPAEEKQGPVSKRITKVDYDADKCQNTASFLFTILSLGLSCYLKKGMGCLLSAACCLLSTNATYKKGKYIFSNDAQRNTRIAYETEIAFATTAIIGAFPDKIINAIQEGGNSRAVNIPRTLDRAYMVQIRNLLDGEMKTTLAPCDPIFTRFFGDDAKTQISNYNNSQTMDRDKSFQLNNQCSSPSGREVLLYLKCSTQISEVFKKNVLLAPKNRSFKVYRTFADAVDAPTQYCTTLWDSPSDISAAGHRR